MIDATCAPLARAWAGHAEPLVPASTGMPQTALMVGGSSDIAGAVLHRLVSPRLTRVVLVGRDEAALLGVGDELVALGP